MSCEITYPNLDKHEGEKVSLEPVISQMTLDYVAN
jgi:hypothetical protein